MSGRISRRTFLRHTALLTTGMSIYCQKTAIRRPNILFIMADDHTSQAWGCYGSRLADYAPTASIDRIAREGALLRNCFCTNSICVPSRASILTGQYSHVNGAKTLAGRLLPGQDNVAKKLQSAGYQTAVIGKWHLKEQPAGFDYYCVLRNQGRYQDPVLYEPGNDWESDQGRVFQGHSTDVITDQSLQWLQNRRSDQNPFCLLLHFKAVHEPFYSAERFFQLFSDIEFPEPEDLHRPESPQSKVFDGWPLEILGDRFLTKSGRYAPPAFKPDHTQGAKYRSAVYQKFIRDYLRTVAGIDDNVGRLLDYLDKAGLSQDTVVIYTSDQGYFLGEHNLFDKRFMLEESLRMPFVVRYPREIRPGTVVDDIILNIDFAELFLDYAGAPVPESMQGRSFRANLRGHTAADWRDKMYYRYWTNSRQRPAHYGIRTLRYKLIFYDGLVEYGRDPADCWELYDLENDPHELKNVYNGSGYQAIVQKLKEQLKRLRDDYGDRA